MEEKLPAAPWFDLPTANSRCDSLKHRLRLSEADLQTVVMARPAVLGLSYENNLEPSLAKLQERLGLDEPELKKVVLGLPTVLGYSYEGNLKPKLDHLQSELGLTLDALRELVCGRGQVAQQLFLRLVSKKISD